MKHLNLIQIYLSRQFLRLIFFWPESLSSSDFWFLLVLAETSSSRIWAFKLSSCRNVFSNNNEGINQIKRIATKQ